MSKYTKQQYKMEKTINKKIETHQIDFKNQIKTWFETHQACIKTIDVNGSTDLKSEFLQFVFDSPSLAFDTEDFQKRKRVKNFVPIFDRCCAKRACNEQCTRRKKEGFEYCGTHIKGTPHGIVDAQNETKNTTQKVEVYAQDIQGIVYYIDKNNNVYQTEDIISNKINPKIIAKYLKTGENYSIPEFDI